MCEAQRGGERAAGRPCRRPPHVGPSSSCSAGLPPHRLPEPPSTASSAASCGTRGPRTSDALPPEGGSGCRLPFEASEPVRGDSGERRGAARGAAPEPHCSTDAKRSVTFTFQLLRKVPDRCRRQGSRGAFSPLDAAPALPPLPLSLLPHLAPQRHSRAHTLHSTPTVRDTAASLWSCAWQPSIAAQAQAGTIVCVKVGQLKYQHLSRRPADRLCSPPSRRQGFRVHVHIQHQGKLQGARRTRARLTRRSGTRWRARAARRA